MTDFWTHPLVVALSAGTFITVLGAIVAGIMKIIHDVGAMKTLMEVDGVHRLNLESDIRDVDRSVKRAHARIDVDHDVVIEHGHRLTSLERYRDAGNPEIRN